MARHTTRHAASRRASGDDGAALVEFALVAPLLFMLVFGIVEFGWVFGQHLDVRHGAREGSRLLAVNYNPDEASGASQRNDIIDATCDRMDLASGANVAIGFAAPGETEAGAFATVTVTDTPEQLTGLFSPILDGVELISTVESRIEVDATWTAGSKTCA